MWIRSIDVIAYKDDLFEISDDLHVATDDPHHLTHPLHCGWTAATGTTIDTYRLLWITIAGNGYEYTALYNISDKMIIQ